jgi:hypothetical protein
MIGMGRTGVNTVNLVNKLAGGTEPLVPREVTGGLGLAGGLGNIANAVLDERGNPVARAASGVGGATDVIRGAGDLGIINISPDISHTLGAVGSGAGTVAGAINLAQNWDRMDDTQKALGTAGVATSAAATAAELGLVTASEAIPYVGAVIAVGNLLYNIFNKPAVYQAKRQQSAVDMAQRFPAMTETLKNAWTPEEIADGLIAEQFNRKDGPVMYTREELINSIRNGSAPNVMAANFYGEEGQIDQGVNAMLQAAVRRVHPTDVIRRGGDINSIQDSQEARSTVGQAIWDGTLKSLPRLDTKSTLGQFVVNQSNAKNQSAQAMYDVFFTPAGIQSKEALDYWNKLPGTAQEKWGTIAQQAGIRFHGDWPDDVTKWATRVTPEMSKAGNVATTFKTGNALELSPEASDVYKTLTTKPGFIEIPKDVDTRYKREVTKRGVLQQLLGSGNQWEIDDAVQRVGGTANLTQGTKDLIAAKQRFLSGTMNQDDPYAKQMVDLAQARNWAAKWVRDKYFTKAGIEDPNRAKDFQNVVGVNDAEKWRNLLVMSGLDPSHGAAQAQDLQHWLAQAKPGQPLPSGLAEIANQPTAIEMPQWAKQVSKTQKNGQAYVLSQQFNDILGGPFHFDYGSPVATTSNTTNQHLAAPVSAAEQALHTERVRRVESFIARQGLQALKDSLPNAATDWERKLYAEVIAAHGG